MIHNGIIENFAELRAELEENGHGLGSDTDTEAVAHLLEDELKAGGGLAEAMRSVCRRLEGAFTLVAVHTGDPDLVVGARRNSPLVVGVGDGENFLASDVAAFIAHTRDAIELGQDQVVELRTGGVTVTDFEGRPAEVKEYHVDWDVSAAEKGGYDYFMLKEIAEQPRAVADTLLGRIGTDGRLHLDEMRISDQELREVDKIIIVACGTSYHAGLIAKYAIEHWAGLPCEVELASEFRYRDPILSPTTLVIAISQSGETMDTLMAVRHAREQKAKLLGICNVNGSTLPRECDGVLYTHAGPEIAVASTKAFLTQLVAVYLIALYIAQVRGTKWGDEVFAMVQLLERMPEKVEKVLDTMEPVRELARSLSDEHCVLFLGRHVGFPVALEGALKLKELAYMHAEGFAAGRAEARPDRAHRGRAAGRGDRPAAGAGRPARQDRVEHPGDPGARRPHDRDRRGRGRVGRAVRRHAHPRPGRADAAAAAGHDRPAAGLRLRAGLRQGPRRGPAPQPRQVRDRRIAPGRPPGRLSPRSFAASR